MLSPWVHVQKLLPVLDWSKKYDVNKAVSDLIAGITVGLTLIPQSIAYASLAGLEPQYGLYSSLCGGLIYLVFGTIPELSIAPTALLSLLTYSYTKHVTFGNVPAAILLCFLSGCIELICGILHLGFLVDFVSSPVVSAFTSASAITIASSQVKSLLGLKFEAETFFTIWMNIFKRISKYKLWDTILGLSCCVVLLFMRKLKDFGAPLLDKQGQKKQPVVKKIVWLLSVSKNALVVVGCAGAALILDLHNLRPFSLTAQVNTGWPKVAPPDFSLSQNNRTITFFDMASQLGIGIIFVPFISILANIGIAKAFAKGKVVDASQEMIAVGVCNIIGSMFGSYPVNASFSRAAVGGASGVRTPLAGVYTAAMVFLAFTLLTPYFPYIPKPTLAAVIICAVIFMVEVMIVQTIWKIHKLDMFPFMITFLVCLIISIEIGILVGILADIMKVLYVSSRPHILVEQVNVDTHEKYVKVTPPSSLPFYSAEYTREKIMKEILKKETNCRNVVMDFKAIHTIDYTTALCLSELINDLKKNHKQVFLLNVKERLVSPLKDIGGKDLRIFSSIADMENFAGEHCDRRPYRHVSVNVKDEKCAEEDRKTKL